MLFLSRGFVYFAKPHTECFIFLLNSVLVKWEGTGNNGGGTLNVFCFVLFFVLIIINGSLLIYGEYTFSD